MKKFLAHRTVGFYLGKVGGMFALIAIVLNLIYGYINIFALIFMVLVVIFEITLVFFEYDLITILIPVFATIALGMFLSMNEVIGSITDYFNDSTINYINCINHNRCEFL